MHREAREIHEAVRQGRISHEEGREKLEALNRRNITSMKKKGSGKEWRKRLKEPFALVA